MSARTQPPRQREAPQANEGPRAEASGGPFRRQYALQLCGVIHHEVRAAVILAHLKDQGRVDPDDAADSIGGADRHALTARREATVAPVVDEPSGGAQLCRQNFDQLAPLLIECLSERLVERCGEREKVCELRGLDR
jgi:hypothetical protein